MQLLTIADLQRSPQELEPLLKEAENLGRRYFKFIEQDEETFSYDVTIFADSERAEGFHASELSGCFKRLVYTQTDVAKKPNPSDLNMKMRFRMGHAVHAMLQNDLTRMADRSQGTLHFQSELKIDPELQPVAAQYDIHSHCDGLLTFSRWYPEYQQWYAYLRVGVEIKTKSDKEYDKLKKPEEYHLEQTNVYMKCLDVPLMWTLYYNKSNSNFTQPEEPYLFKYDPQIWDKLLGRMDRAKEYAANGNTPPREEGMPCGWCPYAWHCQPSFLQKKDARKKRRIVGVSSSLRRRS